VIQLLRGDLSEASSEAVLLAIRSDGAPITSVGRRLEAVAGPQVVERVAAQGESPVGTAFLTPGGGTGADFIIHLVLQSSDEPLSAAGLERALKNALRRASDFGLDSVALPLLGTGPGQLAVEISATLILRVLDEHRGEHGTPDRFLLITESEFHAAAVSEAAAALSVVIEEPP
jgi:O-acetyl-ADP-ribose deacetylase (regulator of RNase III)